MNSTEHSFYSELSADVTEQKILKAFVVSVYSYTDLSKYNYIIVCLKAS